METRTEGIASAERSRHVFRHDALATADRSSPVLPVDLLHDSCPPVDDRQHLVGLLGREHRHHADDAHFFGHRCRQLRGVASIHAVPAYSRLACDLRSSPAALGRLFEQGEGLVGLAEMRQHMPEARGDVGCPPRTGATDLCDW